MKLQLTIGEPGVSVRARTTQTPSYVLDTAAGRYLVLAFPPAELDYSAMTALLSPRRTLFDDENIAFFGVLRGAKAAEQAQESLPGIRWFLDLDHSISTSYRMGGAEVPLECGWIVLDPTFRIFLSATWAETDAILRTLSTLPPKDGHAGVAIHAPVLLTPRVFEPGFCRALIAEYEANGGEPSGFMREVDGKTIAVSDRNHKIRRDFHLPSGRLRDQARARISRLLMPQIRKAFAFEATRMERDLIACYDGNEQGFFRAHRDNTTKGTAHRRFAVTINLNPDDYEGGDLVFPEFGNRPYRAPLGGAVVFSCSLLHAALPVTKGRRYAFLPFLYDEAAARQREANIGFVDPELQGYRSGPIAE